MANKPKPNTTDRGLGWKHQQIVAMLIRKLTDGTLCWWCGLPMFKDKHRNWDRLTLAGDHSVARIHGGDRADRLLHGRCNSQRKDGSRDDVRPAVLKVHPSEWAQALAGRGVTVTEANPSDALAMDW
jgi:hypothetical protein